MKKVIIAEKPSVARNIADAVTAKTKGDGYFEGEHFIITWAFGHLLELYDSKEYDPKMASWRLENYPFVPGEFKYRVKNDSGDRTVVDMGAKKQLDTINNLINREDVSGVISACDYDREGQIIGDIILEFLEVKKPIERLLLNEWTPAEVEKGLKDLISNTTMKPLRDAGVSRQWADWVIGINLTSVATLKYQRGGGKALNIGRVLLPTLKIIYDRDKEIENFVSEEYHKLLGNFKANDGTEFEATYIEVADEKNIEKFEDKAKLASLMNEMKGKPAKVINKQVEKKKEYPQSLFNLSNLQGHVTSKFKGWTSDKVLKVAQELYEKKFITYPRTASLALEESLVKKAENVLNIVKQDLKYKDEIKFSNNKRVFDNSKVESHSAIIPTYMVPKSLSSDEKIIYEAVKNRFVMQFMPIAEHEETVITMKIETEAESGTFIVKGRVQIVKGWKQVENVKSKDRVLPLVKVDEELEVLKLKIKTQGTKPPKNHNEKTLLRLMETCGKNIKSKDHQEHDEDEESDDTEDVLEEEIVEDEAVLIGDILSGFSIGTPATRAETIKKLKTVGYITTKGKSLITTDVGKRMVEQFPIKELFDLEYTGRLEKILFDMGTGKTEMEDFLKLIFEFVQNAVIKIKKDDFLVIKEIETDEQRKYSEMSLGTCPNCGSHVIEGEKGFGCSNWRAGCRYIIWKNDKFLESLGVRPTKDVVVKLLRDGKVFGRGFKSKKGNKFDAILFYVKNEDNDFYSWKMEFPN